MNNYHAPLIILAWAASAFSASSEEMPAIRKDADSISQLVASLNKSPLWSNAAYRLIELPADATAEEVLNKAIELEDKNSPLRAAHKIVEFRKVVICSQEYFAFLLEWKEEQRVFLCRYERTGWWHRFMKTPGNAEQGSAGQSATRSESDSGDGDNPKPESKPRPR